MTRYCRRCAKPLDGLSTRSDKIYCSSTCRSQAWLTRVGRAHQIRELIDGKHPGLVAAAHGEWASESIARSTWDRELQIYYQEQVGGTAPATTMAEDAAAGIEAKLRGATETFGPDVLWAARRTDKCRFHKAIGMARAHRRPLPKLDQATRVLLGEPCGECETALRPPPPPARPAVAASAAPEVTFRPASSTAPSPRQPTVHDAGTGCQQCRNATDSDQKMDSEGWSALLARYSDLGRVPHSIARSAAAVAELRRAAGVPQVRRVRR